MEFLNNINTIGGQNAANFGPVLGLSELSLLLRKSPGAIIADRSRAPHRLPPACTPPGSKQPLWLLDEVLAWLKQFKQPQAEKPPRRGRPTKRAQLEKAAQAAAQVEGGAA